MHFDSYLAKVTGTNHFIWVNGSDGVNRNWVEFLFLNCDVSPPCTILELIGAFNT